MPPIACTDDTPQTPLGVKPPMQALDWPLQDRMIQNKFAELEAGPNKSNMLEISRSITSGYRAEIPRL